MYRVPQNLAVVHWLGQAHVLHKVAVRKVVDWRVGRELVGPEAAGELRGGLNEDGEGGDEGPEEDDEVDLDEPPGAAAEGPPKDELGDEDSPVKGDGEGGGDDVQDPEGAEAAKETQRAAGDEELEDVLADGGDELGGGGEDHALVEVVPVPHDLGGDLSQGLVEGPQLPLAPEALEVAGKVEEGDEAANGAGDAPKGDPDDELGGLGPVGGLIDRLVAAEGDGQELEDVDDVGADVEHGEADGEAHKGEDVEDAAGLGGPGLGACGEVPWPLDEGEEEPVDIGEGECCGAAEGGEEVIPGAACEDADEEGEEEDDEGGHEVEGDGDEEEDDENWGDQDPQVQLPSMVRHSGPEITIVIRLRGSAGVELADNGSPDKQVEDADAEQEEVGDDGDPEGVHKELVPDNRVCLPRHVIQGHDPQGEQQQHVQHPQDCPVEHPVKSPAESLGSLVCELHRQQP